MRQASCQKEAGSRKTQDTTTITQRRVTSSTLTSTARSAVDLVTSPIISGFFFDFEHIIQTDFLFLTQANFEANSADFHHLTEMTSKFWNF